jgi:hypothetical protein
VGSWVDLRDDVGDLVSLQLRNGGVHDWITLQLRLGDDDHIAPIGSGLRAIRKHGSDVVKVFAGIKAVLDGLDFLANVVVAVGLIVLQISARALET